MVPFKLFAPLFAMALAVVGNASPLASPEANALSGIAVPNNANCSFFPNLTLFRNAATVDSRIQLKRQCAQTYTVVSGHTCGAIESKTGVSDATLHQLNPGINNLHIGQVLCLSGVGCSQTYTVVSGDTGQFEKSGATHSSGAGRSNAGETLMNVLQAIPVPDTAATVTTIMEPRVAAARTYLLPPESEERDALLEYCRIIRNFLRPTSTFIVPSSFPQFKLFVSLISQSYDFLTILFIPVRRVSAGPLFESQIHGGCIDTPHRTPPASQLRPPFLTLLTVPAARSHKFIQDRCLRLVFAGPTSQIHGGCNRALHTARNPLPSFDAWAPLPAPACVPSALVLQSPLGGSSHISLHPSRAGLMPTRSSPENTLPSALSHGAFQSGAARWRAACIWGDAGEAIGSMVPSGNRARTRGEVSSFSQGADE
ncbi:hypothetical protein B0H14DRAFT_2561055 [Mycena olivaceomarginata]|nr:hypothetical protein B0H14DRAFT_2561055 [Mycena olivaceomarginata]